MEGSGTALKDYNSYQFLPREWVLYSAAGIGAAAVMGYIFYRSILSAAILALAVPLFLKQKQKEACEKNKKELNLQFKDSISAVSANLQAGYSVENSFKQAYYDIQLLYGKESLIGKELFYLSMGLDNNVTLEYLLTNLAERSGIDDINDFAEIYKVARKTGGDMNSVIHASVTTICAKIEVIREIQGIVYAKQFEQRIMNLVPLFIILYIQSTSKGFFDPLYHNVKGIMIMTGCLLLYSASVTIAKKIITIVI